MLAYINILQLFLILASALPSSFDWPRNEKEDCKSLDFSLVGFARENPIGRTTGGAGGKTTTVSTYEALVSAVSGSAPKVVIIKGNIQPTKRVNIGSNTSLLGYGTSATITGVGLNINGSDNVIVRNLAIRFIEDNDGITVWNSTRVWVDHNEFESRFSTEIGPDFYDGQVDIVRGSSWITVSWNYFHDHWKSSLVGNSDILRDVDSGKLRISYHHNYWRNVGTRGPAGRFGRQHVYNNLYRDFHYQAIHSRSDNNVLVEGNVFRGQTREALSTYGLVIPDDSPNTCTCGDQELDGFANLGAKNDFGPATVNITRIGNFTQAPYRYRLTPLNLVERDVTKGAGVGKI